MIYTFDPVTKYYTGQKETTTDPSHATTKKPPRALNWTIPKWNGTKWVLDTTIREAVAHKDLINSYVSAVQTLLDDKAKTKGYDSIFTACSYADEDAVLKFQLEGKAFRVWRSCVWEKCYAVLADVEQGKLPMPSIAELIIMLPTYAGPN